MEDKIRSMFLFYINFRIKSVMVSPFSFGSVIVNEGAYFLWIYNIIAV